VQKTVIQSASEKEDRLMSDIDRVWELMETVHFCMFSTWTGSRLRSRPMSASLSRPDNAIRFLTDVSQHIYLRPSLATASRPSRASGFISHKGTVIGTKNHPSR